MVWRWSSERGFRWDCRSWRNRLIFASCHRRSVVREIGLHRGQIFIDQNRLSDSVMLQQLRGRKIGGETDGAIVEFAGGDASESTDSAIGIEKKNRRRVVFERGGILRFRLR